MKLPRPHCAICFATANYNELSALCCGHTFHFFCIWEWMKNRIHCPVCRIQIDAKNMVGLLSFRIVKDNPNFRAYYEMGLLKMIRDAIRFRLYQPELHGSYIFRRIKLVWLFEEMKEFELKIANEEIQCTVCLKNLQFNEIAALRCGHTFHHECILQKIQNNHKCPVCDEVTRENNIIPRVFLDIREKDDRSLTMEEAALLINEIKGNLSNVEAELELIHLHIEHNSALLRILSHMINICVKALRKPENNNYD
ncbi:hypothetical protein WUBG_00302 [Wuchereria bancrofti]|uniref:RING-type domain-containing protein n=2 Tax=Wuchereria bancrofti TaxID=6293 RepID=J9F1M2_WUCBA|nr:hypothetical protein WUBG_00302 [Wuchereria bancrofti]VDM14053.1 unnamed protein product [Wuchereria bancrofti]